MPVAYIPPTAASPFPSPWPPGVEAEDRPAPLSPRAAPFRAPRPAPSIPPPPPRAAPLHGAPPGCAEWRRCSSSAASALAEEGVGWQYEEEGEGTDRASARVARAVSDLARSGSTAPPVPPRSATPRPAPPRHALLRHATLVYPGSQVMVTVAAV